jgi:hypothetical protein
MLAYIGIDPEALLEHYDRWGRQCRRSSNISAKGANSSVDGDLLFHLPPAYWSTCTDVAASSMSLAVSFGYDM